ncbi:hypothetical protein B1H29_01030 [Streptomyces pactum]|uniref:Uncharacterized protein n=1 Tax=Streptomyces pactum TaxID=68249 RepID=A0A1S6J1T0_9ACTN|nr:hypothetical protein B1H29_01030 [Streptomyces pactum]
MTTRRREDRPISAQPDHVPAPPHAPAPGAPAELLARRADRGGRRPSNGTARCSSSDRTRLR